MEGELLESSELNVSVDVDETEAQQILEQPTEQVQDPLGGKPTQQIETQDVGSKIGKFKSVEDLVKAYGELEKEFTKKSQKLSDLEKQTDNANAPEREQKTDIVQKFLNENPLAQKFSSEILEKIENEKSTDVDSLNRVFQSIVNEKFVSEDDLIGNEDFLNKYVFENDYIKQNIIEKYLNELINTKSPQIISGTKGAGFSLTNKLTPNSLDEANNLAKKLME